MGLDSLVYPKSPVVAYYAGHGVSVMRWGMIPPWSKEFDSKYPTHNARVETIESKPTYRNAWAQKQRCLIPMSGYFEWPVFSGKKTKFYVTDKDIGGLVVAGLWEDWEGSKSCTMITREPDEYMAQVNHRMLCYLTPETGDSWLNGEMSKTELEGLEIPNVIFYPSNEDL